jgi:hypothetical protein
MLLAVDEAHLVYSWQSFRPEYGMLNTVRSRIGWSIPCIGMTATLPDVTLRAVRKGIGFTKDTLLLRTPIDRPEISIGIDAFRYPQNGYQDLFFLLPSQCEKAQDIEKSVVYFDSIAELLQARRILCERMRYLKYPNKLLQCVRAFFSWAPAHDKTLVSDQFVMSNAECNDIRILLATDSYGLGIDNPDIVRILQWKIPSDIETLYQRMGRAVRDGQGNGRFLMLYSADRVLMDGIAANAGTDVMQNVEGGVENPEDTPSHAVQGNLSNSKSKDSRYQPRKISPTMQAIFEPGICIRKYTLEYLKDSAYKEASAAMADPCCSGCQPDVVPDREVHDMENIIHKKNTLKKPWRLKKLRDWRERCFENHPLNVFNARVPITSELWLSDKELQHIADFGDDIRDRASFATSIEGQFEEYEVDSIVGFMRESHQHEPADAEPFYTPWFEWNEVRKQEQKTPVHSKLQIAKNVWAVEKGYPPTIVPPKKRKVTEAASLGEVSTRGKKQKPLEQGMRNIRHMLDMEPSSHIPVSQPPGQMSQDLPHSQAPQKLSRQPLQARSINAVQGRGREGGPPKKRR